jgi:transposase
MRKSKAYSAVAVNRVVPERVLQGRQGQAVVVGVDVGKFHLLAVPRWADQDFDRPWRVENPQEIPDLADLLARLAQGRSLRVALEPSGTYGDVLRQALHDKGLQVLRVSPKAAHDYSEIFDGVPSQHDGKDAAVIAELAAIGKAASWPYEAPTRWEQEMDYWVDWHDAQRSLLSLWSGRLEALLARHWPEATRVLSITSATLLRALVHYGGPQALAADAQAQTRLAGWGGRWLDEQKVRLLLQGAKTSVGVRQGEVDTRRLQEYARQAFAARQQMRQSGKQLKKLAQGQEVLRRQAQAVGSGTACVLYCAVGDPRDYHCGEAYRKAMGLNLTERSSGTVKGELHISKRGDPKARQWLYFAALRLVKREGVRQWYQAKKARDAQEAKRALVAVMRKLALALYQVGARGAVFDPMRLFPAEVEGKSGAGQSEGAQE